ncbi:MAG: SMP-30/gluconolactonase/LRE family protein [Bryobacterales bacterium]|nr:SMP-30/gluconolactonase/LRE family protein [Bryobacterales bacterium]
MTALALMLAAFLSAQDFSKIQIEKVSAGGRFTEGPVWSKEGFLIFSDVPNNRMLKFIPGTGVASYRENTNGANGNAIDSQGRLLTCESRTRRVVRQKKDGGVEVLADKFEGKRFNAPNDIVVRKDGHIWFTDPAFGAQADERDVDFYAIFHISPKGELGLTAKPKGRPNGIALSQNGRILYVANSDERCIYAYDVDGQGRANNERVVIRGIPGPPDGLKLDEKGNFYVAATELVVYNPKGELLKKIELSEKPSNLAFGDPDYQTLFITARTSVYRMRLDVKGAVNY